MRGGFIAPERVAVPICALTSVLVVSAALAMIRFPIFFPYSSAILSAAVTFGFALGLAMMLPDRWLYSDARLIAHHFAQRHGLSGDRAATALDAIQSAHAKASALRRYGQSVHPDLRVDLNTTADRLDAIAGQLLDSPAELRQVQALIVRSDLLVEAVATHADLRKTAKESVIAESRQRIRAGLAAFQDSFDTMEDSAAARLMHRISASASTAELLLGDRRK